MKVSKKAEVTSFVISSEARNLVFPNTGKTHHGACPEQDSSLAEFILRVFDILRFTQDDKSRDPFRMTAKVSGDTF
jgi:hypothetical protein